MLVVCERWAVDGDRLLYWPSSTSFASWLGCWIVGQWGPKALCLPLALNSVSCLQLIQAICALVILLFNSHLPPLLFRLFTQVHLLIDGSVEGQCVTLLFNNNLFGLSWLVSRMAEFSWIVSLKKETTSSIWTFSNISLILSVLKCRSLVTASAPHSTKTCLMI